MKREVFEERNKKMPYPDEKHIDKQLKLAIEHLNKKIIVLDDDPTGTQTVHDISVYTDWELDSIRKGFLEKNNLFFILTNSRSFSKQHTVNVHKTIAERITIIAKETNKEFIIINRGDSTLRGHYPLETRKLKETIEKNSNVTFDGEIILPFFKEGGRYTIDNIHYVDNGVELVPVGETEFAKDRTFGYQSSDLTQWVEEKNQGSFLASDVLSISLEELRSGNIEQITNKLIQLKKFNKIIVNAIDYIDIKIFVLALTDAINQGKNYLFSSAAAFVKVLGNISNKKLLSKKDLVASQNLYGGLIMVGSHVKKTTEQLNELLTLKDIVPIEFKVSSVLDNNQFRDEQTRVIRLMNETIKNGRTVVIYTSRKRLDIGGNREEELNSSVKIANAVSKIVQNLSVQPKFIIAKGGITSSDIATTGLGIKCATVMGQVAPGVPIWMTQKEAKFSGLPYIIFPGNVGQANTLKNVVRQLK